MPRGGARPGAGRKPTKPKAEKAPQVDKNGFKADKSWPFGQERPAEPAHTSAPTVAAELTPLEYLLSVMRDELVDPRQRMQAASLAAPFVHAKKGEGGKKDEKAGAAAKAGAGKFAAAAPPLKLVGNR